MKYLIICLLFILTSCGARTAELKKEITNNKSQIEFYEKTITELNEKISKSEITEKDYQSEVTKLNKELTTLKKERKELIDKLQKENKDDLVIEGANGTIKFTDSQGNTYEIPSDAGTKVMKSSLSKMQEEKRELEVSLLESKETESTLRNSLIQKDKSILHLTEERTENLTKISELEEKSSNQKKTINKLTIKKEYPVWFFIVIGIVGGILSWEWLRKINPLNVFNRFKN